MFDSESTPRLGTTAFPAAGAVARWKFFARRHPMSIAIVVGLFAGGGAALLIVCLPGLWSIEMALLFTALTTIAVSTFSVALMSILVARKRTAGGRDIAAALIAATYHEQTHLLARIEERLTSRLWSAPMTTFQLVLMFKEVRARHGDRARRKRLAEREEWADQKRLVGNLTNAAGAPGRARQGAF